MSKDGNKKTYQVASELDHNGERLEVGDSVELTEKEAAPLIAVGVVIDLEAQAAAQKAAEAEARKAKAEQEAAEKEAAKVAALAAKSLAASA